MQNMGGSGELLVQMVVDGEVVKGPAPRRSPASRASPTRRGKSSLRDRDDPEGSMPGARRVRRAATMAGSKDREDRGMKIASREDLDGRLERRLSRARFLELSGRVFALAAAAMIASLLGAAGCTVSSGDEDDDDDGGRRRRRRRRR